jgi:ubiquinone/menaquinone biosynthesis C-methylase UbiE
MISERGEQIWGWSSPAGKRRMLRRAKYLNDALKTFKKSFVLEIGCGTGIYTSALAKTDNMIFAIDISFELISKAYKKHYGTNVVYIVCDAEYTPFKNDQFDAVIGVSILHHLEVKRALLEIYRVLKPAGRILFSEPNMLNPQIFFQKNIACIKKLMGDSPNEIAFYKYDIKNKLSKAGFKRIHVTPFEFLHPITPGFLIPFVEKIQDILEQLPIIKEIAGSLLIRGIKQDYKR